LLPLFLCLGPVTFVNHNVKSRGVLTSTRSRFGSLPRSSFTHLGKLFCGCTLLVFISHANCFHVFHTWFSKFLLGLFCSLVGGTVLGSGTFELPLGGYGFLLILNKRKTVPRLVLFFPFDLKAKCYLFVVSETFIFKKISHVK
jgi:hypothetical protein